MRPGLLFVPSPAFWLHAFAFSPAHPPSPGSWGTHIYNLAPAVATRGAEEQKTRRRLPSRKRQPRTPQKKPLFPSVSLQTNGRGGPSCSSNPEYQKGTLNTQDLRARCKEPPRQADPATSILLAGSRLKSENSKACEKTTTYQQQCFMSCTQFMCFFLLFLVRSHYE